MKDVRFDLDDAALLAGSSRTAVEHLLETGSRRVIYWDEEVESQLASESEGVPMNAVITLRAIRHLEASGADERIASNFIVHLAGSPSWSPRMKTLQSEIEPQILSWYESSSTRLALALEIRRPDATLDLATSAYIDTIFRLTHDYAAQGRLYPRSEPEGVREFSRWVMELQERMSAGHTVRRFATR